MDLSHPPPPLPHTPPHYWVQHGSQSWAVALSGESTNVEYVLRCVVIALLKGWALPCATVRHLHCQPCATVRYPCIYPCATVRPIFFD